MSRRYKALLEYDGTDFFGWQIQKDRRTVQGVLEEILSRRFNTHIAVVGSGRTDRGVHARGQVAHFDINDAVSVEQLGKGLRSMLPPDVSLVSVEKAAPDFHARFNAARRSYLYDILLGRSALKHRFCWELSADLEPELMNTALQDTVGTFDFKPFAKLDPEKSDDGGYRCTVYSADIKKINGHILIGLTADRFLHGMVRAITGTVVDIGRGAKEPDCIKIVLKTSDRTLVSPLAPAKGLFLEQVEY